MSKRLVKHLTRGAPASPNTTALFDEVTKLKRNQGKLTRQILQIIYRKTQGTEDHAVYPLVALCKSFISEQKSLNVYEGKDKVLW